MPDWVLPMLALAALLAFLYFALMHKPLAKPSERRDVDDGGMSF